MIFAQETPQRSLVISPPTITENLDPGDQKEGLMKITNRGNTPITFKAVVRDFIVQDTVGTPILITDNLAKAKYSASAWVGVYPNTFTLPAGKTQTINYYIQLPPDARPGGRYAAVVYEPQDRIGVEGTGTGVETHIGSLFIFRVNGDIIENASVTNFAASKSFWEYGPVTINSQILNSSDSHIKPVGAVIIKNLFGATVATQPLPEHNIFPEAKRDFENTLGKKYMVGPYTAELRATYGDANDKTLFASTTFFVLPWKIAAIALLVVIVAILLIIFYRRRKKNTPHAPEVQQATPTV